MDTLTIDGVKMIRLHGTREERAIQHGNFIRALSESQKTRLPMGPLAQKNQYLLKRAGFPHFLSRIYEFIIEHHWKRLPTQDKALLEPFIAATGLNATELKRALFQPDYLMVLAALATDKVKGLFLEGMPGCTAGSFIPKNGHSSYFFRNLDYPIASYWELMNTVFYHEASDSQSYINVAALGMHTAGLTGWNESGIMFSLNAHFSKKISLRGRPVFFLGDEIMRNAHSLAEVIEICKNFKTIGSWVFIVSSFEEKKSIAIELSDGKVWVRDSENGNLCHANGFMNPEFQKNTLHFPQSVLQDLYIRKNRMDQILKNFPETPLLSEVLQTLGDHHDPMSDATRICGNTISVITTVQSVVFSPNEKCFYLSSRKESPTGLGPYLKLPNQFDKIDSATLTQKPIEPSFSYSENFKLALREFHKAYVNWQVDHLGIDNTLLHLRNAKEHLPHDPSLLIQLGYFELKSKNYTEANACFQKVLESENEKTTFLSSLCHYFLGNSHDLLGLREAALKHYQSCISQKYTDIKLKQKAKKKIKAPFAEKNLEKLTPDLQFIEPVEYI